MDVIFASPQTVFIPRNWPSVCRLMNPGSGPDLDSRSRRQYSKPEVIPQWTAEAMIFNPETGVSENRVAASLIGVHLTPIRANTFLLEPD